MDPLGAFVGLLTEISPYLLIGLVLGAALQSMVPERYLARHLRGGLKACIIATLLGVPLPLCSCSVLPLAIAAKNRGAGVGPVIAFIVATPQTDVNSLLLAYALLGPYFTAAKVLTAVVAAVIVGYLAELTLKDRSEETEELPSCGEHGPCYRGRSFKDFPRELLELSGTVGPWLLIGLAASVLLELWVPSPAVRYLEGFLGPVLAALISLPLYVCSVAAIPIAAALVAKGASVGSMLTFTVAGPGTNVATLSVILRFLGGRIVAAYLVGITLCAVAAGYAADTIGVPVVSTGIFEASCHPSLGAVSAAILLLLMTAGIIWRLVRDRT
ncbi:permease [Methanopyrus kandleri]|uniref:Permease n=1 Tax=Methanopyrus kandleri TaxID=2320 RepID=A0A832WP41_9EURY|nr:permease [Methanopyrus kandleri]HII70264.1 permease [Methanopyrus kandleri]